MFEVSFTKYSELTGGIDRTWTERGYADLRTALQRVVDSLPATDLDRIFVYKNSVLIAEVKPRGQ